MVKRGFGVSALIAADMVPVLARRAEQAGYQTFWVNDVEGGNGLEQLARAQEVTSTIRLGVGVLPVDRWSAGQIAGTIDELALDTSRLLVGIGAGNYLRGALQHTGLVASGLRKLTEAKVFIGALGPKMCRLAGTHSDGVLLNWSTPSATGDLARLTRDGASEAGRTAEIIGYIRTAASTDAAARLNKEAEAYGGYPSYKRHFERMGVQAIDTTINGSASEISARFDAYSPHADEMVARAIPVSDSVDDYLAVLDAAAPGASA